MSPWSTVHAAEDLQEAQREEEYKVTSNPEMQTNYQVSLLAPKKGEMRPFCFPVSNDL